MHLGGGPFDTCFSKLGTPGGVLCCFLLPFKKRTPNVSEKQCKSQGDSQTSEQLQPVICRGWDVNTLPTASLHQVSGPRAAFWSCMTAICCLQERKRPQRPAPGGWLWLREAGSAPQRLWPMAPAQTGGESQSKPGTKMVDPEPCFKN